MDWRRLWFNMNNGRLRCGWRVAIFLLIALPAIYLLLRLIFPPIAVAFHPHPLPGYLEQMVIAGASIPAILACSLWALRTLDHLPPQTFGLSPQEGFGVRTLLIGVATGVGLVMLLAIALLLMGIASIEHHTLKSHELWVLLAAAAGVSMVAFAHEVTFRGYLFQTLLRGIGPFGTLLVTSTIFTAILAHLFWPTGEFRLLEVATIFLTNILFGMLYLRMGSLWLPIGLHCGMYIGRLLFDVPMLGMSLPVTAPFQMTFVLKSPWAIDILGPHGELLTSVLVIMLIALLSYTRRGLPLESPWWEWRSLLYSPKPLTCWDFAIGSRYYQWKLLVRDPDNE